MEYACDWQSPAAAGQGAEQTSHPTVASVQRQSPAQQCLPGDSCPAVSVFTPLGEEQTFAMTPGHKDARSRWYPFTFCSELPSF